MDSYACSLAFDSYANILHYVHGFISVECFPMQISLDMPGSLLLPSERYHQLSDDPGMELLRSYVGRANCSLHH